MFLTRMCLVKLCKSADLLLSHLIAPKNSDAIGLMLYRRTLCLQTSPRLPTPDVGVGHDWERDSRERHLRMRRADLSATTGS